MRVLKKLLILFLIFECGILISRDGDHQYKTNNSFRIKLLNERGYDWRVRGRNYYLDISSSHQSIFKMEGITNSNKTERITWKTKGKYFWGNGTIVDEYWVVNPSSYTKNGVGYSMVGFLPEQENTSVVIYGSYNGMVDSIMVHLK